MRTIDLYDLLTIEQREKVSEVFLDAMSNHSIFPEIWEMDIKVTIDSERKFYD